MITSKKHFSTVKMAQLAILTAIVLVLQLMGIGIRLPFLSTPISLVGIPIAIGAMLLGPAAGAWLGFVFGMVVFITCCIMGMDPLFTGILFANSPVITSLICIVKSTVAGLVAGFAYKFIKQKNSLVAVFVSSVLVPVVNTGLFVIGCLIIRDVFVANFVTDGSSVIYYILTVVVGINFIFEFLVNLIFSPAIYRIIDVVSKRLRK